MPKHDIFGSSDSLSHYFVSVIHSSLAPHQMAWLTDHVCKTAFWLSDSPFEISVKSQMSQHAIYKYENGESELTAFLLCNMGSGGLIVSRKPRPDYFLIIYGEDFEELATEYAQQMALQPSVALAYTLGESDLEEMKWLHWLPF